MIVKDSLQQYLDDITAYPLLAADEEVALARAVMSGDHAARDRMIRANLRLVVSVAKVYSNRGVPLSDLIEEGNLGLIKAVEKFDPAEECRFSTYATWWIKQSIRRCLSNFSRAVHIPVYILTFARKWKSTSDALALQLGRAPSPEEVLAGIFRDSPHTQVPKKGLVPSAALLDTSTSSPDPIVLDACADPNTRSPADEMTRSADLDCVRDLIGGLSERDHTLLQLRYGLDGQSPLSLTDLGRLWGLTRERVRQLEKKLLERFHRILTR